MSTHLCPVCSGEGFIRTNPYKDPETGVWEYDYEEKCCACNGTGQLVAT